MNATVLLQLLLAAAATGAENPTYRFVIISGGSRSLHVPPSLSLSPSLSLPDDEMKSSRVPTMFSGDDLDAETHVSPPAW